jgi:hypothetical protein
MADQETLPETWAGKAPPFNPAMHGLWKRFVDNGVVVHGEWMRAAAARELVGTCRVCGAHLRPRHPAEVGHPVRWEYEAECVSCGQIVCAPGGRTGRS